MNNRSNSMPSNKLARRIDPFMQMDQMMKYFTGINRHYEQPFKNFGILSSFGDSSLFSIMNMQDPFEDFFKFSNLHQNIHQKGNQGSYAFQTFTSSSVMGPDGKIKTQNYYENSIGQSRSGHTISQKQQAYQNSEGVRRIAEQRMYDDKGRKIVRQKFGENGPIQQSNHYFNIQEQQAREFDRNWNHANESMKFIQRHQNLLQYRPQQKIRALGYQYQNPKVDSRYINQRQIQQPAIGYHQTFHGKPMMANQRPVYSRPSQFSGQQPIKSQYQPKFIANTNNYRYRPQSKRY